MLAKKIGVDLGTSSVQVYVRGGGIIADEPSLLAVDREDRRMVAIGREALRMLGRTPRAIEVLRPFREGMISDFAVTEGMLHHLIGKAQGSLRLFKPEVMIGVPSGVSSLERRVLTEVAISGGARQAWLLDKPLAAAIGADLPIAEARGHAVCDIGGGATEIAVISLSGMVAAHSVRVGGGRLDAAIVAFLQRRQGLLIGERTAEKVKIEIGAAVAPGEPLLAEVRGRDVKSGRARTMTVTSSEVAEAIQEPLGAIVAAVREVFEQTPPDLFADIYEHGIVLAGGGALLRGVDHYLSGRLGVPVRVADDPRTCVARGAGQALDRFEVLRHGQLHLR